MTDGSKFDGMNPPQVFLEYSLMILHSALTTDGLANSEKCFGDLELALSKTQTSDDVVADVQKAKTILSQMRENYGVRSDSFTPNYAKSLTQMRDLLLDAQERFEKNYTGE